MMEFDQRPTAYSYVRMSSKRQIKGDSLRRQLELSRAYATEHGLKLDETTSFADKGVSAWTGANLTDGKFGQFLDAAKRGQIKAGSYLLVESLDRLSRQQVRTALLPFMELINADIVIVTLADRQVYSKATVDANFTQLIISLTIMSRAHEESEMKSRRLKAANANRLKNAIEGHGRFSPMIFGWIDQVPVGGGQYEYKLNHHAEAVRKIFEWADSGLGQVIITKRLNKMGFPTFRGKGIWLQPNVGRILKNEAVIGTYQPHHVVEGVRQPFGPPIKNHLPPVVSDELFWRVQRHRKITVVRGAKGNRISNLFSGLVFCEHCKDNLRFKRVQNTYLYCDNAYRTDNCPRGSGMFRYDMIEKIVFENFVELDPAREEMLKLSSTSRGDLVRSIESYEAQIVVLDRKYDRIMTLAENAEDDSMSREFLDRMKTARVEKQHIKSYLSELREELAALDSARQQLATTVEQIQLERLKWAAGTDDEVYESRSRTQAMLKKFITSMSVNFDDKILTIVLAGGIRGYRFDRSGAMIDSYDLTKQIDTRTAPVVWKDTDRDGHAIGGTGSIVVGAGLKVDHFTADIDSDHFDLIEQRKKFINAMIEEKPRMENPRLNEPDVIALKARRKVDIGRS